MLVMRQTILIAIIFIGVLLCAVGYSDSQYHTSIGRQAPAIWLPEQAGGAPEQTLAQNRGRFVLVNFWSSTDAASRKAANDYTAWLRANAGKDLRLLSVNVDKTPELFNEIVRRDSLIAATQYHVQGDTAAAIVNSYGLDDGLGSLLISPDGRIVAHNPDKSYLDHIFEPGIR